jgi:hypothetical protein
MRDGTVLGLHVVSVALLFALILEGPDLLLLAVRDVRYWLPVGVASGLLTLPLLRRPGVGFVPPWTMPAFSGTVSRRRVGVYHLVCSVLAAWLWTYPTLRIVAWLRDRGLESGVKVGIDAVPLDPVPVAGGVVLAELLFFLPALVAFVRVTPFRTDVDLHAARASDLLRPAVAGIGSYLLVRSIVGTLVLLARGVPS